MKFRVEKYLCGKKYVYAIIFWRNLTDKTLRNRILSFEKGKEAMKMQ